MSLAKLGNLVFSNHIAACASLAHGNAVKCESKNGPITFDY